MKIGIVGLGLIGGSIYKNLINSKHDIIGISNSQNGKAENITNDIEQLKNAEVVFVAVPINKTLEILETLNSILDKNTIVADCCSLKEFLSNKEYNFHFVPTHPMAGTEFQGFENSFPELFQNSKWVLTPRKIEQNQEKLINIIREMGAIPIYADAKEHDKAVALISHMPMVLAQALMQITNENELAMKLASSGFRDMTRLAMSNTEMANDMIINNAKNIEGALLKLTIGLKEILNPNYETTIKQVKKLREKMYIDGKNIL